MTLKARNCSLFDNNQTDSGVQPASYSVKFQELFIQGKVTGGIELYLHSPYMYSWHAQVRFFHYLILKQITEYNTFSR
jgi:hypothetical protein